jgi:hypothetical protein
MATRTPSELRATAAEFRKLASQGTDLRLQEALRLVADEFEREAERTDARGVATLESNAGAEMLTPATFRPWPNLRLGVPSYPPRPALSLALGR